MHLVRGCVLFMSFPEQGTRNKPKKPHEQDPRSRREMIAAPLYLQDLDRGPLSFLRRNGCDPLDELDAAGAGVAKNGPPDLSGECFRWMDAQ